MIEPILNERELAINRGSDQGVNLGMKFRVLYGSEPVRDPDTDQELGLIDREKIRVKVVHLQPTLAVAQTYETYRTGGSGIGFTGLSEFLRESTPAVTKVRTLRAPSEGFRPVDETDSIVNVGDRVVEADDES